MIQPNPPNPCVYLGTRGRVRLISGSHDVNRTGTRTRCAHMVSLELVTVAPGALDFRAEMVGGAA